jgi:hypothetical protein
MANTLTNLIPTIYKAVDTISRELVGMIPAVFIDASADEVAKGQEIRYSIVPASSAADIVAAATGPDPADTDVGSDTMTITKSRGVTFYWTGTDQKGLGSQFQQILQDQFEQAMRTLTNEVEADLAGLYKYASRAWGTAGTTPFASSLDATANVLRILKDNGAPTGNLQLVINTAAGAALRTLSQLTKANEAGNDSLVRQGILLDIHGFKIRESAQIKSHTKGTGASYVADGAHAAGITDVVLKTGSGTVLAGDAVTFGSDTNKYVVKTGVTAAGTISLNKPGLRLAVADGGAMSIGSGYTANLAFDRNAIHLLARVPEMPQGGDAADDVMVVTDPKSGLNFQIAMYRQRRRVAYEVGLAWGVKAVKSENIAILLG